MAETVVTGEEVKKDPVPSAEVPPTDGQGTVQNKSEVPPPSEDADLDTIEEGGLRKAIGAERDRRRQAETRQKELESQLAEEREFYLRQIDATRTPAQEGKKPSSKESRIQKFSSRAAQELQSDPDTAQKLVSMMHDMVEEYANETLSSIGEENLADQRKREWDELKERTPPEKFNRHLPTMRRLVKEYGPDWVMKTPIPKFWKLAKREDGDFSDEEDLESGRVKQTQKNLATVESARTTTATGEGATPARVKVKRSELRDPRLPKQKLQEYMQAHAQGRLDIVEDIAA